MRAVGAKAYLVNTGWNGTGNRISLKETRAIIDSILDGSIDDAPSSTLPIFNLDMPTALPGVDSGILDPRRTYTDTAAWDEKARHLAKLFVDNFASFTDTKEGQALVSAGPRL